MRFNMAWPSYHSSLQAEQRCDLFDEGRRTKEAIFRPSSFVFRQARNK